MAEVACMEPMPNSGCGGMHGSHAKCWLPWHASTTPALQQQDREVRQWSRPDSCGPASLEDTESQNQERPQRKDRIDSWMLSFDCYRHHKLCVPAVCTALTYTENNSKNWKLKEDRHIYKSCYDKSSYKAKMKIDTQNIILFAHMLGTPTNSKGLSRKSEEHTALVPKTEIMKRWEWIWAYRFNSHCVWVLSRLRKRTIKIMQGIKGMKKEKRSAGPKHSPFPVISAWSMTRVLRESPKPSAAIISSIFTEVKDQKHLPTVRAKRSIFQNPS